MRLIAIATSALLAAQAPLAQACGYCIEDKVAATYDHAIVTRALDQGLNVVFAEVATPSTMNKAQWRYLSGAVRAVRGVRKDSIRVSEAAGALSFVSDRSGASPNQMISRLNETLQKRQLKLVVIRVFF